MQFPDLDMVPIEMSHTLHFIQLKLDWTTKSISSFFQPHSTVAGNCQFSIHSPTTCKSLFFEWSKGCNNLLVQSSCLHSRLSFDSQIDSPLSLFSVFYHQIPTENNLKNVMTFILKIQTQGKIHKHFTLQFWAQQRLWMEDREVKQKWESYWVWFTGFEYS